MNPYITTALTALPVIGGLVVLVRFKLRKRLPVVNWLGQEGLQKIEASDPAVQSAWQAARFHEQGISMPSNAYSGNLKIHLYRDGEPMTRAQTTAYYAKKRNAMKDEIARLKRNKKKHSHLLVRLQALTNEELRLEGMR